MTHGTARANITLMIDDDRCLVCDRCVAKQQCRGSAIVIVDRGEPPFLDMSRCWGCMVCVYVCPGSAVVRDKRIP